MPLGRFLKILLSGLFLLAVLFIATKMDHYDLESLKTSFLLIREGTIRFLSDFVDFVERKDKFIIALSTIFIAFFTIILGIATGLLWRATRSLVRGAENTAERQLRAYVSVGAPTFGKADPDSISIVIENGGETPAHQVMVGLNTYWIKAADELPADFKYPSFRDDKNPPKIETVAVLFRNKPITFTFGIDFSVIQRIRAKEIKLFFYGQVDYVDIFETDQHTFFCYEYYVARNGDKTGHGLILYKDHNDAT